jgi:hypothetical protein
MTEDLTRGGGSSSAGCGILLTQEITTISLIYCRSRWVGGRQHKTESKLKCLASYHAFVSRLARFNRLRLNS